MHGNKEKLETSEIVKMPFELTKFTVQRTSDGSRHTPTVSQNRYLRKLEELPEDDELPSLRTIHMRLTFLENIRPDALS